MGWAYCGQQMTRTPDGYVKREIGYGIEATCDARGCDSSIDRGIGNLCGEMHHQMWDEAPGCGRYFCDGHLGSYAREGFSCSHSGQYAWGRTKCQPMKVDVTGEVYCACLRDHPVTWPEVPELPEVHLG